MPVCFVRHIVGSLKFVFWRTKKKKILSIFFHCRISISIMCSLKMYYKQNSKFFFKRLNVEKAKSVISDLEVLCVTIITLTIESDPIPFWKWSMYNCSRGLSTCENQLFIEAPQTLNRGVLHVCLMHIYKHDKISRNYPLSFWMLCY